ncbi:hypothetical protein ACLK1T_24710 [Escherichia coli]
MPDALRLSGLQGELQFIQLHVFVGRMRRLRRIRQHEVVICQQRASPPTAGFFLPEFTDNPQITPHFTH